MGFYFPSNESEGEAPETGAPATTGMQEAVESGLRAAAVAGVIKGNFMYEMHHNVYKSQEEMLDKVRALCSAAMDNGDLTPNECENILKDLADNWFGGCKSCFIDSFVCLAVSDSANVAGLSEENDPDIAELADLGRRYDEKCKAVCEKYGSIIMTFANDFIRLYNASLNPGFLEKFK